MQINYLTNGTNGKF